MLILLVEDNRLLANNLIQYLALNGLDCDYAEDIQQAEYCLSQQQFDAIVLDVNLPDGSGISACARWKAQCQLAPVILLTARSGLDDRLQGFAAGADDYLIKPFAMAELVARLKAVAKRHQALPLLKVGELEIDFARHCAFRQGVVLQLTPTAWQILTILARSSPNVVSREELERSLWPDVPPDSDSLRSHLHLLRRVVDKPFSFRMLHTIRGVGLCLKAC